MTADPALALTVAYLGLNGYFVLTEQELHIREPAGYRTLTDIDIIALRPPTAPGPPHHHLGGGIEECLIVTAVDPALDVDTTRFDVIVGEVKTGEADINPAMLTPGALHAALRRTGDLYGVPLDDVVDELISDGSSTTPTARAARHLRRVRTRGTRNNGSSRRRCPIHAPPTPRPPRPLPSYPVLRPGDRITRASREGRVTCNARSVQADA